jgi:hypothetical protein
VLIASSSAGSLRSASLVRVMRFAAWKSLVEICASHCALEVQPASGASHRDHQRGARSP